MLFGIWLKEADPSDLE